jgi:hypothetical protein
VQTVAVFERWFLAAVFPMAAARRPVKIPRSLAYQILSKARHLPINPYPGDI